MPCGYHHPHLTWGELYRHILFSLLTAVINLITIPCSHTHIYITVYSYEFIFIYLFLHSFFRNWLRWKKKSNSDFNIENISEIRKYVCISAPAQNNTLFKCSMSIERDQFMPTFAQPHYFCSCSTCPLFVLIYLLKVQQKKDLLSFGELCYWHILKLPSGIHFVFISESCFNVLTGHSWTWVF